jgi:hypothetical protein
MIYNIIGNLLSKSAQRNLHLHPSFRVIGMDTSDDSTRGHAIRLLFRSNDRSLLHSFQLVRPA